MNQLYDLREWLMSQIDGSEETRGEDSLISGFIRQIDALPSEIAEPRGCPTPGACSAVKELADLKHRLLPQYLGRAERAEKARQMAVVERDALLEKLIVHQTTVANLHDVIDGMREKFNAAERDKSHDTLSRSAPSATAVDHSYIRSASLSEGRYVCTCGACIIAPLREGSDCRC